LKKMSFGKKTGGKNYDKDLPLPVATKKAQG
jgi:hypothetical protein